MNSQIKVPAVAWHPENRSATVKMIADHLTQSGELEQFNVQHAGSFGTGPCPVCGWIHDAAFTTIQTGDGEPLSDKLGLWLAARYALATRKLAVEEGELDRARLRELCSDVVALRRGDHSAARLKIEQARLDRERDETEEEVVAHFQRWAKNPKVREMICGDCLNLEERERRLRQIFGLSTPEGAERSSA